MLDYINSDFFNVLSCIIFYLRLIVISKNMRILCFFIFFEQVGNKASVLYYLIYSFSATYDQTLQRFSTTHYWSLYILIYTRFELLTNSNLILPFFVLNSRHLTLYRWISYPLTRSKESALQPRNSPKKKKFCSYYICYKQAQKVILIKAPDYALQNVAIF